MSNYLKYFKKEFEKYAQELDLPPSRPSRSGGGAAPSAPASQAPGQFGGGKPSGHGTSSGFEPPHRGGGTSSSWTGGGVASDKPVRAMQTAIQNLAKTISSTIDYDALIKSMSQPNPQPGAEDQAKFKAEYGKDMFSNFMVNMMRGSGVKGIEYDTDPKKQQMSQKNPSELKSMYVILDSMRRVGNPQRGENFVDGDWGPRTNNALKNIVAIGNTVAKLGTDLGMQSNSVDPKSINELGTLIPNEPGDIDRAEKINRAPKVAELVNSINALFHDFKQQVFQEPAYRNLIEGKAPILTIKSNEGRTIGAGEAPIWQDIQNKGAQSAYVAQQGSTFVLDQFPKEMVPPQFQKNAFDPHPISAADLVDRKSFEAWASRSTFFSAIMKGDPAAWKNVATSILQQVSQIAEQRAGAVQQPATTPAQPTPPQQAGV